jgi:hypothetical protein
MPYHNLRKEKARLGSKDFTKINDIILGGWNRNLAS